MLLSHSKKFIYLKTVKTASTSVESFFEPYCLPEGEWWLDVFRNESVSDAGIVGYRGLKPKRWFGLRKRRWFDHMPALQVKKQLDAAIWESYFKFCVIRNPFDKVISAFHFFQWMERRGFHKMPVTEAADDIERFRNWVRVEVGENRKVLDRQCYTVDQELCVDFVIRYENLLEGLEEVCQRLGISPNLEKLPNMVGGVRPKEIPISNYYDDATKRIVESVFDFELEEFGYEFPC